MSALRQPRDRGINPARTGQQAMSIGVLIKLLQPEFPDVTVSKIRFLESEGLISPSRTQSGYRRFVAEDVERLRYILSTQRDNYTPLKVIRQQLDAMDAGELTALMSTANTDPMISPEEFRAPVVTRLTDDDIAEQAGVDASFVGELIAGGLITSDASGFFTADDVRVVTTAYALGEWGVDIRHLKAVRNAARAQALLISQVTEPVASTKSDVAKHKAHELSEELASLVVSLHAALVKNELKS